MNFKDGIPIRGPYGGDGRLVSPSELDECNGRTTTNEQGEKANCTGNAQGASGASGASQHVATLEMAD